MTYSLEVGTVVGAIISAGITGAISAWLLIRKTSIENKRKLTEADISSEVEFRNQLLEEHKDLRDRLVACEERCRECRKDHSESLVKIANLTIALTNLQAEVEKRNDT